MKKRGLSTIIVTIILIALVLIALGILWTVINKILKEKTEEVSLETLTVDAEIMGANVDTEANNISISVRRKPGGGNLIGFKFVFNNGTYNELHTVYIIPSMVELEERFFTFNLSMNVSEVLMISLVPIIKSGDKELPGVVIEKYNIKTGRSVELPTEPGAVCGNNIIEEIEICDGTDLGGENCTTQGYDFGNLSCLSSCLGYDTSACNLIEPECGDGLCETGENCSVDSVGCPDNTCYEPTCTNGCGQTPVSSGGNDEGCISPLMCNGVGSCVECVSSSDCDEGESCIGGNCVLTIGYQAPADRVPAGGMWTPGIPGGIPERTTICATLNPTGDSTDRTTDINNALNSCGNNEVVLLNPGTYYVSSTITVPSNRVLRGSGMDQTTIHKTGSSKTVIRMGSCPSGYYDVYDWQTISSGFDKDSYAVTVTNAGAYQAGDLVLVTQADGSNPDVTGNGMDCTWGKLGPGTGQPFSDYASIGQTNIVESVSGNIINLVSPLYYDFSSSYSVSIGRLNKGVENAGVEDLTIIRDEAASNSNEECDGEIFIGSAVYSWLKNVREDKVSGNGVNIAWSYGVTVHGSEFLEAWHYTSGGGGYQMMIKTYSSNILVENCIMHQGTPNFHFDVAGAGSVMAYNWVDVAVTNGGTDWAVYNCGPHCDTPFMVLWEGNVISIMENDNTHNTNAVYWFHLRNHYDAIQTEWLPPLDSSMATDNRAAINFKENAQYWTVIGNVLGREGDSYGAYQSEVHGSSTAYIFRSPNDVLDTLIRHGNYDYYDNEVKWCSDGNNEADCQGYGDDHDLPDSLYLSGKPSWWDDQGAGRPWPSIGPDVPGYVIDIPAKDRFEGEMYES